MRPGDGRSRGSIATARTDPSPIKDMVAIARRLYDQLGDTARLPVQARSDELDRAGDHNGAAFWRGVDRALRLMVTPQTHAPEAVPEPGLRRERLDSLHAQEYLRRAMAAEARAASARDGQRQEMLDIAFQWYDLALQAQSLADARAALRAANAAPVSPRTIRTRETS